MDDLMSRVLTYKHADVLAPSAVVSVPVGWYSIADAALDALRPLHPRIEVYGLLRDPETALLCVTYAADFTATDADVALAEAAAAKARDLSAWTCTRDARTAWLVQTRKGPAVLCEKCQAAAGLEVRRHAC